MPKRPPDIEKVNNGVYLEKGTQDIIVQQLKGEFELIAGTIMP